MKNLFSYIGKNKQRQYILAGILTTVLLLPAIIIVSQQHQQLSSHAAEGSIYSAWPVTAAPSSLTDPDTKAVELGVKFKVDVAGQILGIRYYKGPKNTGKHVGSLWNSLGSRLATAKFVNETTSGWQEVRFSTPVTVAPNTVYIASYHTTVGRYAGDNGYFTSQGVDSGFIHLLASNHSGGNGVYSYGSGGFPNLTFKDSNYWVDILFLPAASAPTALPTQISNLPTITGVGNSTPTSVPPQTKGCAANPHLCGYSDATNTGVPAGTILKRVPQDITSGTGWHYDSRGWITVDTNGAVVDGITTALNVDVTASNVTIKNSRIAQPGDSFGISVRHTANVTITHNEIYSPSRGAQRMLVAVKDIYGDSTNLQVIGNNIYNTATGIQFENGLIQDNYIHDLSCQTENATRTDCTGSNPDHLNGTTSNGGTSLLTIRHNTIFNTFVQTDAISLFEDFGVQANRVIDNNLIAGGGYCVYGGQNPGGQAISNIKITNNRFSRLYYPNCGSYGPITAFTTSGIGNVFSGNVWDDTNAPVTF